MATKAESQDTYQRYLVLCREMEDLERRLAFQEALAKAQSAVPLLTECLIYQRRYLKPDVIRLQTIDAVLRYAPALFSTVPIDEVDRWFQERTRTEKSSLPTLAEQITTARHRLGLASQLWKSLSPVADPNQPRLTMDSGLLSIWQQMGLVVVDPKKGFRFVTHPDRTTAAKCAGCGKVRHAAYRSWFERTQCPTCGKATDQILCADAV